MSEFTEDDYRHGIVRIFGLKKQVVGAGFLVAKGYVMTCAHVVLQAIGVETQDYPTYLQAPKEKIQLDFPILACHQYIFASVIDWLPYNLDTGDIALLKLDQAEPLNVKSIPLKDFCSNQSPALCVYGFGGDDNGGQTDAYQVKTVVAAGRLMLCKKGEQSDETIQPGYSGASVWSKDDQSLLGMVAAAKVTNCKAYVIPSSRLQVVLQKLDALDLRTLILSNLSSNDTEEPSLFEQAIEAALKICNPHPKSVSVEAQLHELSTDRPAPKGWEKEGALIRFAIALAWQGNTSDAIEEKLKEWVNAQEYNFSDLYVRYDRDMKKINVQQENTCEHLMVVVEPEEKHIDRFRVSIWPMANRQHYKPSLPPKPIIFQHELARKDLPKFIRTTIKQKIGVQHPMIHLFIPYTSFCDPIEMEPTRKTRSLGSEFPLVYRSLFQNSQNNQAFQQTWQQKWKTLAEKKSQLSSLVFQTVTMSSADPDDWLDSLEEIDAAILNDCDSVEELFKEISQEFSLPVALWVRDKNFQAQVNTILNGNFDDFPNQVHRSRQSAMEAQRERDETGTEQEIGHHIALVWDDPLVVPPLVQLE